MIGQRLQIQKTYFLTMLVMLLVSAALPTLTGCDDQTDTKSADESWRVQVMHELIADSSPEDGVLLTGLGLSSLDADQTEIEASFLEHAAKYPSTLPRLVEASAYLPDRRILRELVEQSPDPCILTIGAVSLLSYAITIQDHALLTHLLQKGCNPNAYTPGDLLPLITAIMNEDQESVELLLRHDADPDLAMPNGQSPRDIAKIDGLDYFDDN